MSVTGPAGGETFRPVLRLAMAGKKAKDARGMNRTKLKGNLKQSEGRTAALTIERLPISKLIPHPRNPRVHPEPGSPAWKTLQNSIEHDYFDPLVWNKRNGMLVSGHLRRKVLEASGFVEADCVVVDYDEPTHIARMIAANKAVGENNDEVLKELFDELKIEEFNLDLTGFYSSEVEQFLASDSQADNVYTSKIIAPIYAPKGDSPNVKELVDRTKTTKLLDEIAAANLPAGISEFLRFAAYRHTIFNFSKIAEFYCHADTKVQDLFEKSGLVIIDFHKAIENGFVNLTEQLGRLADIEEGGEDGE